MNDSFIFYKSYYDAISSLDREQQLNIYDAICRYSLYGEETELSKIEKAIFTLIKPTLEANFKRREDGKKGGRPKKNNEEKNHRFSESKTTGYESEKPNVNVNVNVNDNVNENVNADEEEKENTGKPYSSPPSEPNVETVVGLYHEICKSYPKIKSISEARRKAVRARLRTYGLGEFRTVFSKAEESDFLKGKNERNWSATFDWIIKDSNFAKILDGNYDNKSHSGYSSKNSSDVDKYKCVINQFDLPGGQNESKDELH